MTITHAGLRSWAKGLYPLEAAVELLVRTADGRFASPGYPWIQPCDQPGWWWLNHEAITDDSLCALSGGEQRILRIVASLAGGQPVNMYADLAGLEPGPGGAGARRDGPRQRQPRTRRHPHRPRPRRRRPRRPTAVPAPLARRPARRPQ